MESSPLEMPCWAVNKFHAIYKERIADFINLVQRTIDHTIQVNFRENGSIVLTHSKEADFIKDFFIGLKKELDTEILKESILYTLEDTNYILLIKDGLRVASLHLSNKYASVLDFNLLYRFDEDSALHYLDLDEKDIRYVNVKRQEKSADVGLKFASKSKKAKAGLKEHSVSIVHTVSKTKPISHSNKNKQLMETSEIKLSYSIAKSKCEANIIFENPEDAKETLQKLEEEIFIDNYQITIEEDPDDSCALYITDLHPTTDEARLQDLMSGYCDYLPEIIVYREGIDPKQEEKHIEEGKSKLRSLFAKYLSLNQIQNMQCEFYPPQTQTEHMMHVFVSIQGRGVGERFKRKYDGKSCVIGTQRVSIKAEEIMSLLVDKELFVGMSAMFEEKRAAILLEERLTGVKIDFDCTGQNFYIVKAISKNWTLSNRIINQFTALLKGEALYVDDHQDNLQFRTPQSIEDFLQKVQEGYNMTKQQVYIAFDPNTRKLTIYSSCLAIIHKVKEEIQSALDTKELVECIDVQAYHIKQIKGYIEKLNRQIPSLKTTLTEESDKIVSLDYMKKMVYIKGDTWFVDTFKQNIEQFRRVEVQNDEECCPICYESLTDNSDSGCLLYNCLHKFCRECFVELVISQNDKSQTTCPLPNCGKIIALQDIREVIPNELIKDIINQRIQLYLRTHTKNYRNCPTPNCKFLYSTNKNRYNCQGCQESYCVRDPNFPHKPHPGEPCLAELRAFIDKGDVKLTKCCGIPMTKNQGCNHITCICGKHFCYICRAVFNTGSETSAHIGSHNPS